MKEFDLVIIGFGKAGKTLAKFASQQGQTVAVVEQSPAMYGGTCINIGCIPSKTLVKEGLKGHDFTTAMSRKRDVVEALNHKNYHNLADEEHITVFDHQARFKSNTEVELLNSSGEVEDVVTAPSHRHQHRS